MTSQELNKSGISPTGYRILILADVPEEKTHGGIIIPISEKEKFDHASKTGLVVAIGPEAYRESTGPWCSEGDRICYARYSGEHLTGADGKLYRLINDDSVQAVITDEVRLGELDRYEKRQAHG